MAPEPSPEIEAIDPTRRRMEGPCWISRVKSTRRESLRRHREISTRAVSSHRACDPVAGREQECGNHSRLKAKIS